MDGVFVIIALVLLKRQYEAIAPKMMHFLVLFQRALHYNGAPEKDLFVII